MLNIVAMRREAMRRLTGEGAMRSAKTADVAAVEMR
jgi:hypothetical protein